MEGAEDDHDDAKMVLQRLSPSLCELDSVVGSGIFEGRSDLWKFLCFDLSVLAVPNAVSEVDDVGRRLIFMTPHSC